MNADYANIRAATVIAVQTEGCTNSFADRGFHLVVFASPQPPLALAAAPSVPLPAPRATPRACADLVQRLRRRTPGHPYGGKRGLRRRVPGRPAPRHRWQQRLLVTPDAQPLSLFFLFHWCTTVNADYANSAAATDIVVETSNVPTASPTRGSTWLCSPAPLPLRVVGP